MFFDEDFENDYTLPGRTDSIGFEYEGYLTDPEEERVYQVVNQIYRERMLGDQCLSEQNLLATTRSKQEIAWTDYVNILRSQDTILFMDMNQIIIYVFYKIKEYSRKVLECLQIHHTKSN